MADKAVTPEALKLTGAAHDNDALVPNEASVELAEQSVFTCQ